MNFLENNTESIQILGERPAKAEELSAFQVSKWSNQWVIIAGVFLPFIILGLLTMELFLVATMSVVLIPIFYLLWKETKKVEAYINSRKVYTIEGNLSCDQEQELFYIGDKELKLHRKWIKALESKNICTGLIKIEALMHTYNYLSGMPLQKLQPLTLVSGNLKLKESEIKSTRHWLMLACYLVMLSPLLFMVGIDRTSTDFYYGLRSAILSHEVTSIEDIYSPEIQHRQYISIKAMAIPVVKVMTNGTTGEPVHSLDGEAYFFPRKKIVNYREILGLDKVQRLKENYTRVSDGHHFIKNYGGGSVDIPLYHNKFEEFFNYLNSNNKTLDQYNSYQKLKKTNRSNFNFIIFDKRFELFEKEVTDDILKSTFQVLERLYEIEKNEEGIIARADAYRPLGYLKIAAFLNNFPREQVLEGSLFLSDNSSNHIVSKYRELRTDKLVRIGIQLLLWIVLLLVVIYLCRLLIIRVKSHYF